jgi:Ca-activated chloride channel family protein
MFIRFFIGLLLLTGIFSSPVFAAEHPDELYRNGRFAEAEKAYAAADMDHPKDIRYRYNRGCAAFQNSDYKKAVAAFSSVMRRTKEDETRFRAAYNLGNTAFKQGDFASASVFYKKALLIKPDSEDARYNLELALREEEKQKKQAEQEKDKSRQGSDKSENKDKQSRDGEKKQGRDRDEKKNQGESKKKDESEQGKDNGQDKDRKPEQDKPEDLSGGLKPREAQPEEEENEQDPASARAMMDKKKAEALLDNIKENPAKFFRYQIPKDKRRGVKSGKNW